MGGRRCFPRCPLPARYVVVMMAHAGFMVVYGLRVNMSVAIVAMVNATFADANSTGNLDPECTPYSNSTDTKDMDGTFMWDQNAQGLILSSFFYGYIVMQIPAALLCSYIKSTTLMGIGILLTALLTLLTPLVADYSFNLLIVLRILEGLCEGVTFPCMHSTLSRWAPKSELVLLTAISYSGVSSGTFIALGTSGFLCDSGILGGWPLVFYVFGGFGILWYLLWVVLIYDSPSLHPRIDECEKVMILKTVVIKARTRLDTVPWMSMATSVPFLALVVLNFCSNWFIYTMLTGLPSFFKEVLNLRMQENGLLSAIPYACALVCALIGAWLCDWVIKRGFLSCNTARKLFIAIGATISVTLMISMTYFDCDEIPLTVAFLAFGYACFSTISNIFAVNQLDLAPQFADILQGITNTVGTLAGCLAPLAVGALTQNKPTRQQWQKVIYITAGLAAFGCSVFLAFGQTRQQPWAVNEADLDEKDEPAINDDFVAADEKAVLI